MNLRYASELDVPINEIYAIVEHLIYWAKVKVIYPISETNIYVINPTAQIHVYSSILVAVKRSNFNLTLFFHLSGKKIVEDFSSAFGQASFHYVLSHFSYAKTLVDHLDPSEPREKHVKFSILFYISL